MEPLPPPRTVHSGPVFNVERLELPVPGEPSATIVRDIVRHPGAVAVVPIRDDGRLVLIRNHRIALGEWLVELCAGKLERGERPDAAAARELEEETGYRADRLRPVGTFYTSPGFADEKMHVFEAAGLTPVPRRLEPGERVEVFEVTLEEALSMIDDGRMVDGKSIAGLMLWLRRCRNGTGEVRR